MNIKLHVFDERVYDVIDPYAQLEVIVPDMHLTEGAVWDYENDRLLFNDIPVSNTMSWTEKDGAQVIYNNHNKANGQCFDPQGRLVVCEHASSHLSRCTSDGMNYEVLATHYKGIEINSPNDVICRSDGMIYFTDPAYGRQNKPAGIGRPIPSDMRPVYISIQRQRNCASVRTASPIPTGCASSGMKRRYWSTTLPTTASWLST